MKIMGCLEVFKQKNHCLEVFSWKIAKVKKIIVKSGKTAGKISRNRFLLRTKSLKNVCGSGDLDMGRLRYWKQNFLLIYGHHPHQI